MSDEVKARAEQALKDHALWRDGLCGDCELNWPCPNAKLARDVLRLLEEQADAECCPHEHAERMSGLGYSYDAKAGIWWKDDDKPGVLEKLEAEVAYERERNQTNVLAYSEQVKGLEAENARLREALQKSDTLLREIAEDATSGGPINPGLNSVQAVLWYFEQKASR